jgi:hypothetical protein
VGDDRSWTGAIGREARAFGADRQAMGFRRAALRRLRYHAAAEWLGGRIDTVESRVGRLEAASAELAGRVTAWDAEASARAEADRRLAAVEAELVAQARLARVHTVMDWIEQATIAGSPLISVVLPTRNRADRLPRAVASVLAQSYDNWELLIVDDGSTDGTAEVIAGLDDRRISSLPGDASGVCAARNRALAKAAGEIVCYIDDDNTMHPHWLRAVAWAFEQHPASDVLYGAFVVDDIRRVGHDGAGELPRLFFHAYDHASLVHHNVADIGAIAHRAGLAEGHFDEALTEMGDWDLLLRLTRDEAPLELPAIACYYHSDAPDRLSAGPTSAVDLARLQHRNRR